MTFSKKAIAIIASLFLTQLTEVHAGETNPLDELIDSLEARIEHCKARKAFLEPATRASLEETPSSKDDPEAGIPPALAKLLRHQEKQISRSATKGNKHFLPFNSFNVFKRTCETLCNGNIARYENILDVFV